MKEISIYSIQDEPIGSGGMGQVFEGTDPQGNKVAIKKMRTELTADANLRAFFHKEVNTLTQLEHQSIVKMYASFEEKGNLYLVMEYVVGETIEQYVKRKGAFSESEAIRLLSEILPAIGYLHQMGFVHRDIKPGNIMIRPNGKVCLIDFGIVKDMKHSSGHTVAQIIGSDGYMSPEQANAMSIDYRSDIYSLGCVLYYMLVGSHAIQKQPNDYAMRQTIIKSAFPRAKDFNPNLSESIQRILNKATDKNMLLRFQSCHEFELELSGGRTVTNGGGSTANNMISVGREDCDIIIPHKKVSRHHLDIIKTEYPQEKMIDTNLFLIRDRSTNGTTISFSFGEYENSEKIHNSEKTIHLNADEYTPNYPKILLADEVELNWEDIEVAFIRKQGTTKPSVMQATMYGCLPAYRQEEGNQASHDKLGIGWGILAFIVPLAGWIMYFVWKNETPKRANAAGIIGTIAFVTIIFVLNIIASY